MRLMWRGESQNVAGVKFCGAVFGDAAGVRLLSITAPLQVCDDSDTLLARVAGEDWTPTSVRVQALIAADASSPEAEIHSSGLRVVTAVVPWLLEWVPAQCVASVYTRLMQAPAAVVRVSPQQLWQRQQQDTIIGVPVLNPDGTCSFCRRPDAAAVVAAFARDAEDEGAWSLPWGRDMVIEVEKMESGLRVATRGGQEYRKERDAKTVS